MDCMIIRDRVNTHSYARAFRKKTRPAATYASNMGRDASRRADGRDQPLVNYHRPCAGMRADAPIGMMLEGLSYL